MRPMIIGFILIAALPRLAARADEPRHLQEATAFVKGLKLEDTHYNHGEPDVQWKGMNGATKNVSHTDCSGFVDALFMHSYDYSRDDFKKWFGKNRPTADTYHDAIVQQKGFVQIVEFKDTRPGDFLAVKYLAKKSDTGHIMLAARAPRRIAPKKPLVADTEQWEITVIDSSKTGHGPTDTRHKNGENGKDHTGLGEGVLRVYTQPNGKVAGFTWSSLSVSQFQNPQEEDLVVGRLKPGFKP
ncbi:MAG TPA: hypothetical protein VKS79_00970 [Gemmataceae bacterium]|nr:hypothetical protein [Gemmataceae bacterium]